MSKHTAEALRIIGSALMLHKEDRDRLDAAIAAVEAEEKPARAVTATAPASKKRSKK